MLAWIIARFFRMIKIMIVTISIMMMTNLPMLMKMLELARMMARKPRA